MNEEISPISRVNATSGDARGLLSPLLHRAGPVSFLEHKSITRGYIYRLGDRQTHNESLSSSRRRRRNRDRKKFFPFLFFPSSRSFAPPPPPLPRLRRITPAISDFYRANIPIASSVFSPPRKNDDSQAVECVNSIEKDSIIYYRCKN